MNKLFLFFNYVYHTIDNDKNWGQMVKRTSAMKKLNP